MAMEKILNNGIKMPMIGLGTYLIKDKEVCKTVVKEALKLGYRLIDTATAYQNEQFIGEVVENLNDLGLKREDIFITTKIAPIDQGKGKCRESVLRSIADLKTPYLDLVLIHWPGASGLEADDPKHSILRRESWEDLEQLSKEGKIKSIGISNYMINHIDELLGHCTIKPVVNQVEFHPLLYQKELLDHCNKTSIFFQAYSSLGAAKGWETLSSNQTVNEVAKKYNKSVAQILLKWALQHGVGIIPKTSKVENLKPNFDLFDFEISQDDMNLINSLNNNTRFCWDPIKIR